MGMAYSKAWTMVKNCEANLGEKLLSYTTGGKNGGGAVVTDAGKGVLSAYTAYCAEMEQLGKEAFLRHFSHIMDSKE